MANQWQGKSKGTVLGHRIFVFLIRSFGLRAAYLLLYFVAFYYCLFSFESTRSSFTYFRKRRKYSFLSSCLSVYRGYLAFGQSIIDKVTISSGLSDRFTFEFDGVEKIEELLALNEGGVMISAHIGNFEVAQHFMGKLMGGTRINVLTTDQERGEIKEYLESVTGRAPVGTILYQEDMGHIFEIHTAMSRNELICLTGDRFSPEMKKLEADFLGAPADFPMGPFHLGSRICSNVLFVYVMKESTFHYHLYARSVEVKKRDANDLLAKYVHSVEEMLEEYPLQWYNYFDFWNDNSKA